MKKQFLILLICSTYLNFTPDEVIYMNGILSKEFTLITRDEFLSKYKGYPVSQLSFKPGKSVMICNGAYHTPSELTFLQLYKKWQREKIKLLNNFVRIDDLIVVPATDDDDLEKTKSIMGDFDNSEFKD